MERLYLCQLIERLGESTCGEIFRFLGWGSRMLHQRSMFVREEFCVAWSRLGSLVSCLQSVMIPFGRTRPDYQFLQHWAAQGSGWSWTRHSSGHRSTQPRQISLRKTGLVLLMGLPSAPLYSVFSPQSPDSPAQVTLVPFPRTLPHIAGTEIYIGVHTYGFNAVLSRTAK